jgi:GAF domain-containing protein
LIELEKKAKYEAVIKSLRALRTEGIPASGNLCNLLGQLRADMGFFWCGLYQKMPDGSLGLGGFQGLPACTKIKWGKGVCGTAASTGEIQIVPDVLQFPGYIACHTETSSEIVIPYQINGETQFVLDVDSVETNYFDETDSTYLQEVAALLAPYVIGAK